MTSHLRLGVNIDHIATLRNARGTFYPDPVEASLLAQKAGADGITFHLREDRRHIRDEDVARLKEQVTLPLNMEMAATEEMLSIALNTSPNACCIVPERREEVTTEGGLDVVNMKTQLIPLIDKLKAQDIRISLFVEADPAQLEAAKEVGADIVELHTGSYANATGEAQTSLLNTLIDAAKTTQALGLECHAGHGLTFDNVTEIAAIKEVVELNIGHFIIGQAVLTGLESTITHMRNLMDAARKDIA